jgi:hypothetical protein
MARIYIAGKYEARTRLIEWRGRLKALGQEVTSSWLDETPKRDEVSPDYERELAMRDVAEVNASDLLILDTLDPTEIGGREVEFGIAYLRGLDLWIVGPKRNIFHQLADKTFIDWPDVLNEFRGV